MKTHNLIILLLLSSISFGQSPRQTSVLSKKIDSLSSVTNNQSNSLLEIKSELKKSKNYFNEKIDFQNQTLSFSTNSVSTSLSGLSNYLTGGSIIFGLFILLIAAYITWIQSEIVKILSEAKGVLNQQKQIQKDVNHSRELIENDLDGLYQKLQDVEVTYMLKRLKANPQDLVNLFSPLASKNIDRKHYPDFKEIALKCHNPKNPEFERANYEINLLLFQHFPSESYFDRDIGENMRIILPELLDAMFPSEVEYSTEKLIKFASNRSLQNNSEILKYYFESIENSKHANNDTVYKDSYTNCISKENKFILLKTMLDSQITTTFVQKCGKLLLEEYQSQVNDSSEAKILENVKSRLRKPPSTKEP